MNRRRILIAGLVLPVLGCAQATQTVSDIETAASALVSILPEIQKIAGLPAATYTLIANEVAAIEAAAKQYAGQATATVGGQISAAWGAIQTALSGVTLPTIVQYGFQALSVALPYILQIAGIAAARAPMGAVAGNLTYPQAMSILHGLAGR